MDEEKHKHRCAVRQLIYWRRTWGLAQFRAYLKKSQFSKELLRDLEDQWMKGNRADEYGEWK